MNPTSRPPRLAMLTLPGLDHFTGDLLTCLPAASGWDVRLFAVTDPSVLRAAMAWTDDPGQDALWFEFCWPPFPQIIAQTNFGGRRVIVRVHRVEAVEAPHVANTHWENVDDVIVVSPDMEQRVRQAAPEIAVVSRLHLIPNGVDTDRFRPSASADPFRIGWCGMMTTRKNPTLALYVLARLRAEDPRYHLRLSGMSTDVLARDSFLHLVGRLGLTQAIVSDGRVARADMPAWHSANGVLLHSSLHEGMSYAILEAAASGCDLAVFDHPGAETCWPAEVLFGTVEEGAALIRSSRPWQWRDYVCGRFSSGYHIGLISKMLNAGFKFRSDRSRSAMAAAGLSS